MQKLPNSGELYNSAVINRQLNMKMSKQSLRTSWWWLLKSLSNIKFLFECLNKVIIWLKMRGWAATLSYLTLHFIFIFPPQFQVSSSLFLLEFCNELLLLWIIIFWFSYIIFSTLFVLIIYYIININWKIITKYVNHNRLERNWINNNK